MSGGGVVKGFVCVRVVDLELTGLRDEGLEISGKKRDCEV